MSESKHNHSSLSGGEVTPVLAFNGGTYVRPNRKERKALYFMTGEQDVEDDEKKPEIGIIGGGSSSASSSSSSCKRPAGSEESGSCSKTGKTEEVVPILKVSPCEAEGSVVRMKDLDLDLSSISSGGVNNNCSNSLSTNSEENFECFGQGNESFCSNNDGSSPSNLRNLNDSSELVETDEKRGSLTRNGWTRTSLRRNAATNNSVNGGGEGMNQQRRWGSFRNSGRRGVGVVAATTPSSNALASQLYRSSSYHSSGRSSAGDGEEMYSDSSLEGEVIDLTKKVHHLEEKFSVLAENQNDVDDRYTRGKQENTELKTKLFILEEQLRDAEQRADEKLREEQRRNKEAVARVEREKQLQLENVEIKQQMMEKELSIARIDVKRLEGSLERERNENNHLADKCGHLDREISSLREQNRDLLNQNRVDRESMAIESAGSQQALVELKRQLESLSHFHMNGSNNHHHHSLNRQESTDSDYTELKSRLKEAEDEIRRLKVYNRQLEEANEELNAQLLNQGLEDGRNLLQNLNCSAVSSENSLAAELEAMSNEEMRNALKDQKESNHALRAYIDNILLNIVEHYPQLLEVKNKSSTGIVSN